MPLIQLPSSIQTFGGLDEGFSIQGASHIKHDKICQDFGDHYRCDEYAVAIVCDGHGGDAYFRSDRGSRFAVQAGLEAIKELMSNKADFLRAIKSAAGKKLREEDIELASLSHEQLQIYSSDILDQLIKNIIVRWNNLVADDMAQNPFSENELSGLSDKYKEKYNGEDDNEKFSVYGSTLIAVVYSPEFWFGMRIGDGKCVSISKDGSIKDPIPWDEKCFLNRTTSLCDNKAFENFRKCFYVNDFPAAIYVGTDGVDDSYGTDERLFSFYKTLTKSFAQNGFEEGKIELKEYLPKMTSQGSGDDISISGIIDMEAIQSLFVENTIVEKTESDELIDNPDKEEENIDTDIQQDTDTPII